jgi:hypothetical protein
MHKISKKEKITLILIFVNLMLLIFLLILFLRVNKEETQVDKSIRLGSEWFLNNQNENFLAYETSVGNSEPIGSHPLREMAGLWAVTSIAQHSDDRRFDELSLKGFRYFESYFQYNLEKDSVFVNITPGANKLGYSAFMVLALTNINIDKKDEYLDKLGSGILQQQNRYGSFKTYFDNEDSEGVDYYPGEALLALMTLYEQTGKVEYLDSAKKAFPFYRTYWRNNKNTAFVPWHSRADYKLYQATKDEEVALFIFEMNDWMVEYYKPKQNCSEFNFSGGIRTGVYMEGMNKAFELARDKNDKKRMNCYGNFVKEGADSIIALQVLEEWSVPRESIGGFRSSPESDTLRVDNNQHAVMALIEAKEAGIIS